MLKASLVLEQAQEEILTKEIAILFRQREFIELEHGWILINHRKTVQRILDCYGSDTRRQILLAVSIHPLNAKEIAQQTDLPISTVYREIDELLSNDLLMRIGHNKTTNKPSLRFLAFIKNIKVDIDGPWISVFIKTNRAADVSLKS
jgi:DNA-binding transcriptional ArsR family regulator